MTWLEFLVGVGQVAEQYRTAWLLVMGALLGWCTGAMLRQWHRRLRPRGRR